MTKEELLQLLHDNDKAVLRAVHVMCKIEEEHSGNARDGMGLTIYDKPLFSQVNEMLYAHQWPSKSVIAHCRQRCYSYWRQLLKKAEEKEQKQILEYFEEIVEAEKQLQQNFEDMMILSKGEIKSCSYGICDECVNQICLEEVNNYDKLD